MGIPLFVFLCSQLLILFSHKLADFPFYEFLHIILLNMTETSSISDISSQLRHEAYHCILIHQMLGYLGFLFLWHHHCFSEKHFL